MKILILANFGMGLYKFRKELLEELIRLGHEVFISLPDDDDFIPKLKRLGCEFIDTPVSRRGTNPMTDLKLLLNYRKMMKQIRPDLVLTYTIKPNIYGGLACRLSGIPYIPNITGLGSAVENPGLLQKILMVLYKSSMKQASCVFFQNQENMNFFIQQKLVTGKHQVIPGSGVNLEEYPLLDYPSDENVQFLFISRVMKEKGIDQYLDAAAYIKNKYPHTVFNVVGFCEEQYEPLLHEMQQKGIIRYYGRQNDVRPFYANAHCIIHPTYYPEGMSNVLLESAASGRPVITTNRSGCREIVDDGITGFIIEPKNSEQLIEKIETFLQMPYEQKRKMGFQGRRKVEQEFDRQYVLDAYRSVIEA